MDINVNYAKKDLPYEVLTLYNDTPFTCDRSGNEIRCVFDKVPSTPVFKADTVYFSVNPQFLNKKFVLKIKVKTGFLLKSFNENIYNDAVIGLDYKKAKKWVVIASKKIPFLNNKQNFGLDFYFIHSVRPYIGTIDENGNPVEIDKEAEDVIKFFEIQKAYKKGKDVLDAIDDFVKTYPDSIFLPDVLYMKLTLLDSQNKPDDVISLGKKWIKKYAFNENLPKVLLIIGKNYTKLGFMSDASYFFQRIITEYPNTKEAFLAMIYWADQMYITGDDKKAFELYKRALYNTKDVEVASLAAMRLAQRYMDKGKIKIAFEYYKKVYEANKNYILKNKKKAFELAKTLASHQLYSLAVDIGKDLLKKLKKTDDLYEPLEYYLALWCYDMNDYEHSAYWINKYLKEFPYGDYSDQLTSLKDKVLFEVPDKNTTLQLKKIDEVIKKYKGEPIAKKALYKKIMLLYKLKKYEEILKLKKEIKKLSENILKDPEKFLYDVAKKYALTLIKKHDCFNLVTVIKSYKIVLDKKYDDKIYNCAVKVRDYRLASIICNKYLDSPDDKVFVKWMKRKIDALEGLEDYKNMILAIDDLCQVEKNCYDYKLKKFFALWKLKRYKEALKVAVELSKTEDIKNTDVFIKVVNYALKNNDTLTAAQFAKKIVYLQNRFKAYPYSPFADFTFAKYTNNKLEAVKVLENLLPRVDGENKARAYYMLANLTKKREYLEKCVKVKNSELWKNLCKDAMDLF